jgi:hypothetical protein
MGISGPGIADAPIVLDANFQIKDDVDQTKVVKFQASGLTSGATRTITLPDVDGTLALTGSTLADLVDDTTPQLGAALDTNSFAVNESKGADVVAATTTDIFGGDDGNTIHITGNTQIDDFTDASSAGQGRKLIFDGTPQVTSGSGITVFGGTRTAVAGDMLMVFADTVSAFDAYWIKADGTAVVVAAPNIVDDTSPQLGADLDPNEFNIAWDGTPATDHTANGPTTNTFNAGYTNALMDLVYMGSGGKWLEADADATGTSINMLGIALEVSSDTNPLNVAMAGSFVRDDTWNWTPGVPLYVSGTLGAITATAPSGSGDVVRTVGFAVTADVIYFNPSSDYLTVA